MKRIGQAVSPGLAKAPAHMVRAVSWSLPKQHVTNIASELEKIDEAIMLTKNELKKISIKGYSSTKQHDTDIIKVHLAIATDPEVRKRVRDRIVQESCDAAYAYYTEMEAVLESFAAHEDTYIGERRSDIIDVRNRMLSHLHAPIAPVAQLKEDVILVGDDLLPSRFLQYDTNHVKGIVTRKGGMISHTVILARASGIPMLVGVDGLDEVKQGQTVILDALNGFVILDPDADEQAAYSGQLADYTELMSTIVMESSWTPATKPIQANIHGPEDLDGVQRYGADGIGLFRTEMIYMKASEIPTEEEQYEIYKRVLSQIDGPIVVRTLDIGADKQLPYGPPASELRGIAHSLAHPELLKPQLRALLRASGEGDLRMLLPMVRSTTDIRRFKSLLARLVTSKTMTIPLGIMVETTDALKNIDSLAHEVDFLSIGTNDLKAELSAAGRSQGGSWYDPTLLAAVNRIIQTGHRHGIEVTLCGEMAADPLLAPVLYGLDLDVWSVHVQAIPLIRRELRKLDYDNCRKIALECLKTNSEDELRSILERHRKGANQ